MLDVTIGRNVVIILSGDEGDRALVNWRSPESISNHNPSEALAAADKTDADVSEEKAAKAPKRPFVVAGIVVFLYGLLFAVYFVASATDFKVIAAIGATVIAIGAAVAFVVGLVEAWKRSKTLSSRESWVLSLVIGAPYLGGIYVAAAAIAEAIR